MPTLHSSFKIAVLNKKSIVVLDGDHGPPLTHGISEVIKELQNILPNGIGERTVYYKAASGCISVFLIINGGFAVLTPCSLDQQRKITQMVSDE